MRALAAWSETRKLFAPEMLHDDDDGGDWETQKKRGEKNERHAENPECNATAENVPNVPDYAERSARWGEDRFKAAA